MDDIVERLRAYSPAVCAGCDQWNECGYGLPCDCECHDSPCSDAAAEIERLLAENRRLHLQLMIAYSEAAEMYNDGNDARRG